MLGHSRTWKWPRQSREESEESMESPLSCTGISRQDVQNRATLPPFTFHNPSPVLNTLNWRTNQPCDSDITLSVTKTLLSCFFSLKFSFPLPLLFDNIKVKLETPTGASHTTPLPIHKDSELSTKPTPTPKPQRKQRVQQGL